MPRAKSKTATVGARVAKRKTNYAPEISADAVENVIDLEYRPRKWQAQIHRTRARFKVLVCHRRAGKTVMAVMELIDKALKLTLPDGRFGYVAPLKHQAKDVAWSYLKMYGMRVPNTVVNETETFIEFNKMQPDGTVLKARIKIYGADDPDSIRGGYFDGVVLDELAQMKPTTWGEVIRPMLSDRNGWCIFLGTPKGINLLSELYTFATDEVERKKPNGKNHDWYGALFTVYDTQAISEDEIQSCRDTQTERQFRQEYLCDFNAGSEDCLLALDDVTEAQKRYRQRPAGFAGGKLNAKIMGVDVARKGGDNSCICIRCGKSVEYLKRYSQYTEMELVFEVMRLVRLYRCDGVFVDSTGGYGDGVVEQLHRSGMGFVVGIEFGGRKQRKKEGFLNKRAEMWWDMAEWVKTGGMLPDDNTLSLELCSPTYGHTSNGEVQLESKEEMKARGLHSPDSADALALTFAQDVYCSQTGVKSDFEDIMEIGSPDMTPETVSTGYDDSYKF